MSRESQLEREENDLYEQHDAGRLTAQELERELNELHRDYQAAAREAAMEAYEDELGRW